MPGIVRSFEILARNLGRVGIGQERFGSSRVIDPTIDAENYSPAPWYGLSFIEANAPVLNFHSINLYAPPNVTLSPLFAHNFATAQFWRYWTSPGEFPTTDVVNPLAFGDQSVTPARAVVSVAIPTMPPNAPQLTFVANGIIELAPLSDGTRLTLQQTQVQFPLNMTLWWREFSPVE